MKVWIAERNTWVDSDVLGVFRKKAGAERCIQEDKAREQSLTDASGYRLDYDWRVTEHELL